jgi:hypothetical protein
MRRSIASLRRQRHQCPRCGRPAAPYCVHCHVCLRRKRQTYRRRCQADLEAWTPPVGPNRVGCSGCGRWCEITSIPYTTPCCAVTYFVADERGT